VIKKALIGEDSTTPQNVSRRMSLVIGARRHLEWGHEKYIMDTIQSHATLVGISIFQLFSSVFNLIILYGIIKT
jgi:hypothetical protein